MEEIDSIQRQIEEAQSSFTAATENLKRITAMLAAEALKNDKRKAAAKKLKVTTAIYMLSETAEMLMNVIPVLYSAKSGREYSRTAE